MGPLRFGIVFCLIPAMIAAAAEPPLPKEPAPDGWQKFPKAPPDDPPPPAQDPSTLVLAPGTRLKIRTEEPLSSEHSKPGELFGGTLAAPLIVNGYVVAYRGQPVTGRVVVAEPAGKVKGTSRLGLEITGIQLVNGHDIAVKTQFMDINGPTTKGRDAAAIGATTATGAAIGAAVGWGVGAAIGAAAGAFAGVVGVLATKGEPTIIPPEAVLSFRLETPVTLSSNASTSGFPKARPEDYAPPQQLRPRPAARPPYPPPPPPYPYAGSYRLAYH